MTIKDFENYKKVCDEILSYLKENDYSSKRDVFIILKIISGYPYCLDEEGHFSYKGKLYSSIKELPLEALNELLPHMESHCAL